MKRGFLFFQVFFAFAIILFLIQTSSALGIIPAKVEENFVSGLEKTIIYTVTSKDPTQEFKIYVEGDLAQYIKFDKEKLIGGGEFTATLKLPTFIEKPGKHRILIIVEEKIEDDEVIGTAIGTSVTIKGAIDIFVPYPGKYLEISLKSHDVNIGEPVDFELEIISGGKEDVNVTPKIEIISLSTQESIEILYLKTREIKSRETIKLKKTLDTTNYNPGNYKAIASIDYGDKTAKVESEFRIGELVIYIVNYTRQIIIGNFKAFDIEIESKWNDKIDGAYAEVFIFDDLETLAIFKTFSTSLTPWEKKIITGFFDTSNFTEGFYNANITLIYYGRDTGKSSNKLVEVEFIKEKKEIKTLLIIAIILGILILLIMAGLLIKKYFLKNVKKTKK